MGSSRRQFLRSTLGVPLAVIPHIFRPASVPDFLTRAGGQVQFENPHFIRYDASCFTINDHDTFVFSAAFHYPRCPQPLWRDRLMKLRRAGFNTIETYVFWNYHEPQEGRAELGEFEAFIKLVKEMGLWMIVRPGPYVCAEWEAGGFPHWVVAKRFPLRSNHPESIKTSQHWFRQVMPVIQRHQVTLGGPVIMVQLENEYDYWKLPDADKREYIRSLAQMSWHEGINVPLITCWTKQVRVRSDADMARITDTCNFYPRWNIVQEVVPALQKLRKEEPTSPLGVTELQGGWFSEFGGRLSVDQEGVSGAQLNILTKTVIEQGVTYFSYYMGFGGTNFDWAAKNLTTTYDYAAPIREPGGLWEKYYAARGIGALLNLFGSVLTRASLVEGATQSTNKDVSVTERVNGKSAIVFVRENANAEQRFKMTFRDPNSPTQRVISVPRENELVLGPREMKMLVVQVPIAGSQLRYSTAEVLAYGSNLDRPYLIIYDEPSRVVEISLATEDEPHVEGDVVYQYWDPEYESVVIGVSAQETEKFLLVNNHLLVVLLPRGRALRTWAAEFPTTVVVGAEGGATISAPVIADSVLMAGYGSNRNRAWADLDFQPGQHDVTVLLPPVPGKCRVDGFLTDFQYDRHWRTARAGVRTPPLSSRSVALKQVQSWVEKFDPDSGRWLVGPARPLEELGPLPYSYVKYRAQFPYGGERRMYLSAFANDGKKVFLNGKLVIEASNTKKRLEFSLADYAQAGTNTIEIAYELFGSPNFGGNLGEPKGLESVRYGTDLDSAALIDSWQIQRFPASMRGREVDPEFSVGGWRAGSLGGTEPRQGPALDLVPAFTWCRAELALDKPTQGWSVPWKVTFEADRDALLYLNGRFVGRYMTIGPQKDFYLPEPYLEFTGRRQNVLTIMLAYTDQPAHILKLLFAPYEEFATYRTRLEFEW